ncbi:MAG: hypothetical protein KJZ58_06170 [Flavobacteriales bacterium]|nr:hypothetical protein [Flavobacteriales bacterium]
MKAPSLPPTIDERSARLHGLNERLRERHFGIDAEIQRLLDAFAPWYRFAESQMRPRTIGLWGMTGTGKSSLVRSLVKAVGLEDRTFWLDASELNNRYGGLSKVTDRIEEHLDGAPFIIVVDEFQHARTTHLGVPLAESNEIRHFWELLDSGRILAWPSRGWQRHLYELRRDFKQCVNMGVRVHQGKVTEHYDLFHAYVMKDRHHDDEHWAIPARIWDDIRDMHQPPMPTIHDIGQKLATLNEWEILDWLEELETNTRHPRFVNASKALIILLGNLDELYVGGKEPMAELDPEVLAHRHQDLGRAGVQHALLRLFRIEQVGRIGGSHVVFPPVGQATIDAIVQEEVGGLAARLSAHTGRRIEVDAALVDHLRATSSIAVLGARPVVQAVQNTVPMLLSQALENPQAVGAEAFRLGLCEGVPVADLHFSDGHDQRVELAWAAQPEKATTAGTAKMGHIAVHEAGHLLCGVLLRGRKPLQVCVRTRDPRVGGFVVWDVRPGQVLLRADIIPELAVMLAGRAAEELHFGAGKVSAGNEDDIRKATAFALDMARNEGMGAKRLHYAPHAAANDSGFHTVFADAEIQAQQWVEAAEALAMDTLRANRDLFLLCLAALKKKGSLGIQELEELFRNIVPTGNY